MIYEVRMVANFDNPAGAIMTLIDYIEAPDVATAVNIANRNKHIYAIELSVGEKNLYQEKSWGYISSHITVCVDAVVAKPHLCRDMKMGKFWSKENLQNLYDILSAAYDKLEHSDEKTKLAWWVITLQNAAKE